MTEVYMGIIYQKDGIFYLTIVSKIMLNCQKLNPIINYTYAIAYYLD